MLRTTGVVIDIQTRPQEKSRNTAERMGEERRGHRKGEARRGQERPGEARRDQERLKPSIPQRKRTHPQQHAGA